MAVVPSRYLLQLAPGTAPDQLALGWTPASVMVDNPSSSWVYFKDIDWWCAPLVMGATKRWWQAPGQTVGPIVNYRSDTLPIGQQALQPAVTETIRVTFTEELLPESQGISVSPGAIVNTFPRPVLIFGPLVGATPGVVTVLVAAPPGARAILVVNPNGTPGATDGTTAQVVDAAGFVLLATVTVPASTSVSAPLSGLGGSLQINYSLAANSGIAVYALFDVQPVVLASNAAVDMTDRAARLLGHVTVDPSPWQAPAERPLGLTGGVPTVTPGIIIIPAIANKKIYLHDLSISFRSDTVVPALAFLQIWDGATVSYTAYLPTGLPPALIWQPRGAVVAAAGFALRLLTSSAWGSAVLVNATYSQAV